MWGHFTIHRAYRTVILNESIIHIILQSAKHRKRYLKRTKGVPHISADCKYSLFYGWPFLIPTGCRDREIPLLFPHGLQTLLRPNKRTWSIIWHKHFSLSSPKEAKICPINHAHDTEQTEMQFATRRPVFVARILLAQVSIPWACAIYFAGNVFWNRKLTDREEDEEEIYSGHKGKEKMFNFSKL